MWFCNTNLVGALFKSRENAKRELFCYSLASIDQKKQSEHCMKDIQTHGTRFWAWYYGFCFCSHVGYCWEKKYWIVFRAKHQREGFYYYLYGLAFYLQLAWGPQILCKTELPAAHEKLLKGPQVADHCFTV